MPITSSTNSGFKIDGAGRREFEDFNLDEYLTALADKRGELTVEQLKSRRVRVGWIRSGNFDARWSIYNALVSEQEVDSRPAEHNCRSQERIL
jgi:uncharacterized protein (TIGR04141 family)